jgi:8-oxo-dGTP diphosphatase
MVRTRRRGTAIVDTPKGILVVSLDGRNFLLPGGGAWRNESERDAVVRELKEETGLEAVDISYLFGFRGVMHKGARGGTFRNAHKVFLVTAAGIPEPRQEIKRVAYYDGSGPKLSYSAQQIIAKYLSSAVQRPMSP